MKKAWVAGIAVAAIAASAAGAVWLQGRIFDREFETFAREMAEKGVLAGALVNAEQTGRGFARRDLSIGLRASGLELHWTGSVRFGLGMTARLSLDKTRGTMAELSGLGVEGLEDEIVVTKGLFAKHPEVVWRVKPFRLLSNDVLCSSGGFEFSSTDLEREGRALWHGLTCAQGAENVRVGEVMLHAAASADGRRAEIRAAVAGAAADAAGLRAKTGAVEWEGTLEETRAETAEDEALYAQTSLFRAQNVDYDGERIFDAWTWRSRMTSVPARLAEAVMFGDASGPVIVEAAAEEAIMQGGMTFDLDECTVMRNGSLLTASGRIARDGQRLGALFVRMDPEFGADIKGWSQGVEELKAGGRLRTVDGRLEAHVEFSTDGVVVNGVRLDSVNE